jgi:hypothetical protein
MNAHRGLCWIGARTELIDGFDLPRTVVNISLDDMLAEKLKNESGSRAAEMSPPFPHPRAGQLRHFRWQAFLRRVLAF